MLVCSHLLNIFVKNGENQGLQDFQIPPNVNATVLRMLPTINIRNET